MSSALVLYGLWVTLGLIGLCGLLRAAGDYIDEADDEASALASLLSIALVVLVFGPVLILVAVRRATEDRS